MDNFQHIIAILDIGLNIPLEIVLQTAGIQNIRHLLHIPDDRLDVLEYMKGDVSLPVPDCQITSQRLFIQLCKYKALTNDPVIHYQLFTKEIFSSLNF